MKKYLFTFIFLLFSSAAQAGMYLSGGIGLDFHNDSKTVYQNARYKYDTAAFYSGAIGYALPVIPVRVELEGIYNKSNLKNTNNGHMETYGALANAYVRIPLLGLYAGAGGGYVSVRHKTTSVYQGMFGVEYGLFGLNFGIEYKHTQSSKDVKRFAEESSLRADVLLLKLRFEF
ncbi:MAG: hypothetical protein IJ752_01495 [Alphaproteobacteria bacterium]|nr:hypothetical protein [Alphaproteobacteria bacterium]